MLLLEAGPRDWHPFIHMPAGLAKLAGNKGMNWDYSTAPEPQLDNRALWWPRGKVLGGSSSINAMCYIRGVRARLRRLGRARRDRLGLEHRCCPTSSAAKATRAVPMRCMAATARSRSRTCAMPTRFRRSSSKRAAGRLARNDDFNGRGRMASASTR